MEVIDPGHSYQLKVLDGYPDEYDWLHFVKREGPNYPGNKGHNEGTTVQEVLRACTDRLRYVNNQIPSEHTQLALGHLRAAIQQLEQRAAIRHGRDASITEDEAEFGKVCLKCNHVKCEGGCH